MTLSQLLRRLRRQPSLKGTRQPFVGLVLALPEDDPENYPYLSFGIGCFHFGANPATFDGSAQTHVEEIERCLSQSPIISDLRIDDPELGWFESDLPFGLDAGGQPLPAIRRLRIDFRLELSAEDQQRFYPWGSATEPAPIDVSIRQGPAVPVAFVVPRNDRDLPSRAVTLTWHALRDLTAGEEHLVFDIRAPSPIHTDCFLVPFPEPEDRARSSQAFEYERVPLAAGTFSVFAYDPRAFSDIETATATLFAELELPAGVYYEIEGASWRLRDQWEALTDRRDELAGLGVTGVRAFFRRTFLQGGLLRTLALDLTEFESSVDSAATGFGEVRRDLADTPGTGFLLDEIDELLRTGFRFSTERVSNLLGLFETRRLARAQNRVGLVGALLAAAIGAASALWVSGGHDRTTVTIINRSPTPTVKTQTPAKSPSQPRTQRPSSTTTPGPATTTH